MTLIRVSPLFSRDRETRPGDLGGARGLPVRVTDQRLIDLLRRLLLTDALEDLHARVPLIGDVDAVLIVDEETGGQEELAWSDASRADKQQDVPVGVEDLEVVERRVGDVDMAF